VPLRIVCETFKSGKFRQVIGKDSGIMQQHDKPHQLWPVRSSLVEFLGNRFWRDLRAIKQSPPVDLCNLKRVFFDLEIELGRKAKHSKDSSRVFTKAKGRNANTPNLFINQITSAVLRIYNMIPRVNAHCIDRDITSGRINLEVIHDDRSIVSPALNTVGVGPKGCNLVSKSVEVNHGNWLSIDSILRDVTKIKLRFKLVEGNIGCNVHVRDRNVKQEVPHGPADNQRLRARKLVVELLD